MVICDEFRSEFVVFWFKLTPLVVTFTLDPESINGLLVDEVIFFDGSCVVDSVVSCDEQLFGDVPL